MTRLHRLIRYRRAIEESDFETYRKKLAKETKVLAGNPNPETAVVRRPAVAVGLAH